MKQVLKTEYLDLVNAKIKLDPAFGGLLAEALGMSIYSLPRLIKNNSPKFAKPKVLELLHQHFGIEQDIQLLAESAAA